MEPLLTFSGVELYYDQVYALRNVSLEVNEGETVALIGANGAGKTSILRAITGLRKIRSGEIRFRGQRIDGLAPDELVKMGIAMVPEGRRSFQLMSVKDNLLMGAFTRHDKAEVARTLEAVLTRFPRLRERYGQAAGTMSGGEQQMLVIGRALMSRPTLLLLDALARHRPEASAGHRSLDRRHQSRRAGQRAAGGAEFAHRTQDLRAGLCAEHRLRGTLRTLGRASER
jgi:branched-chain amino acid transport system ATP-binding protein